MKTPMARVGKTLGMSVGVCWMGEEGGGRGGRRGEAWLGRAWWGREGYGSWFCELFVGERRRWRWRGWIYAILWACGWHTGGQP